VLLSRGHQGLGRVAGLHWGWLLIAIGAHAAGFYALTQTDFAQRLEAGRGPAISDVGPIRVSVLADSREKPETPEAAEEARAEHAASPILPDLAAPIDAPEPPRTEPVAEKPEAPAIRPDPPGAPATEARVYDSPGRDDPPAPPPVPSVATPPAPVAIDPPAPDPGPAPTPKTGKAAQPASAPTAEVSGDYAVAASGDTPGQAPDTRAATNTENQLSARFDADHLRNSPPAYPQASRRRGEEGLVILRVKVTANGRAQEIEIAESSGHPRLDRAAQDAVARWRFEPARDGMRAIDSWVKVPVVFRLERS
jgi:protein TonB